MAKARKGNGEGSICYETARNAYRAALVDPEGKRITKRFKTKAEASEWLTLTRASIYKDSYVAQSDMTLGEWVLEYLNTYCAPNVRPKTLVRYQHSAKFLSPLADMPLQRLTAHGVQKFYNSLPVMSFSSKLKIHRLLKSMMKKAHNLGMTSKNIMDNVEQPRTAEVKEIDIFTQTEIKKILSAAKNSTYYSRYYPIIALAIATGARLGELLGLTYPCVKPDKIIIRNSLQAIGSTLMDMPPKTKAGNRTITISPNLEQLIKSFNADKPLVPADGYVFATKNGTPIAPNNMEKAWKQILIEAGISHRPFHTLRHTHATQLLANGVPILEVTKRLGHARASHTLNLYGHAIPGYDHTIPSKVDAIFFS